MQDYSRWPYAGTIPSHWDVAALVAFLESLTEDYDDT
jgi:uncharacterized protein YbdZ (MbtH family)